MDQDMQQEILQNINVFCDRQEDGTICMLQGKDTLPTREELGKIHLNILLDSSGSMTITIPSSVSSSRGCELTLVEDDPPLKCNIKKKHNISTRATITRIGILTALYSDLFQKYNTTFRILCYNSEVSYDSGILELTKDNVSNIAQDVIDASVMGGTQVWKAFEEVADTCEQVDSDRQFVTILLTDGYDHSEGTSRRDAFNRIKDNIGDRKHLMITMGIGTPNVDFDSDFLCRYTTLKSVTDSNEAIYGETCEEMSTVCVKGYSKLLSKVSYYGMANIVLDNICDTISNSFDPSDCTSCAIFKTNSNIVRFNINDTVITIDLDEGEHINGLSYYYDNYNIINVALNLLHNKYTTYSEKYQVLSELTMDLKELKSIDQVVPNKIKIKLLYNRLTRDYGSIPPPPMLRLVVNDQEALEMYNKLLKMIPEIENKKIKLTDYINNNINIIDEIIIERIEMPIKFYDNNSQLVQLYNMCYSKFCDYRSLKNRIAVNQMEMIDMKIFIMPIFTYQVSSSETTIRCASLGRQCSVGINSQLTSDNCTSSMYNGDNECYICMKNKANIIFVGCNHINVCHECLDRCKGNNNGAKLFCPLCKDNISDTIFVDKSHLIDKYKCIGCKNKTATMVFTPCGHMTSCKDCVKNMENVLCPVCSVGCKTVEMQFNLI
jgi:hypothetical protein